MENKIITVGILFGFLLILIILEIGKTNAPVEKYKILKVLEADEFYIDINKNNKIDADENFKLKDIIAFKPVKSYNINQRLNKLGLSLDEYLKLGYVARLWAIENLENKEVILYNITKDKINDNLKFASIIYNNEDLGEYYLKHGLAELYAKSKNIKYLRNRNYNKSKQNAKLIDDNAFIFLNLKNNTYHNLNCEYLPSISNGALVLKNKIDVKLKPCHSCVIKTKTKSIYENKYGYIIPKSKSIYRKSIYKNFSDIEFYYINPYENIKPLNSCKTDICKRIVKEINASKSCINLALFEIDNQAEIMSALNNAIKRGVIVKAVVDKSATNEYINKETFANAFGAKRDSKSSIMHNKFIVFDDRKVMTGSTNLTNTGFSYNSNSVIIINSSKAASIYNQEFNQMYNGHFSKNKKYYDKHEINLTNSKVAIYFSPNDDIYNNVIAKLLKSAKEEIFVSIFYLTDKNFINELIAAKKRNVNVLVMIDALGAINFKDRIKLLKDNKIPVITENWGGKNYEKTIMIDSNILITGSANFSKSAFYKNDENILVIKNALAAKFYRDYYLYLFNSIDKKYLKFIPRAESFESIGSCDDGIDNNFDGKIDKEDIGCKIY